MNIPNPKPLPLLAQDNTKIKAEVQQAFSRGDLKWSTGATVEEKQEGLNLILGGLKTMKIWISREFDQAYVQTLNQQYQARYDDVKKKLDYLEDYKSGKIQVKTENNSQIMQKQGDKEKNGGKDEEKEKMQGALSDAIVTEKPNVKWTDIAGLEAAKGALQEAVIIPIRFPQIFEGPREPWKGILMYGPPGTGKTFMAKACATEADGTFFSVSSSDLISKYVGESEKLIRTLFNMAREKKPSIIFIDEIDSMCGARGEGQNDSSRRVITEFLVQMQGVGHDDKGVLVLGATNLPWALDEAIRRRFQKRIYIPLPDQPARAYIIKNSIKKIKHTLTDDDINVLASKTEGYSGSDIKNFVTDAVYQPVRKLQTAKKFRRFVLDGQQKITPAPNDAQGPDIVEMSFMDINSNELYIPDISFVFFSINLFRKTLNNHYNLLRNQQDRNYWFNLKNGLRTLVRKEIDIQQNEQLQNLSKRLRWQQILLTIYKVFILPICDHSLCKSCAQQKIFNQVLSQENPDLLVCPICKTQIKIIQLQNTIDKEQYLKIYQLKIERNKLYGITLNEELIQCFQCAQSIIINRKDQQHLCEFCFTVICLICNRSFHKDISCLQAIQQYTDAQKQPEKQEIKNEEQNGPENQQLQKGNKKIRKTNTKDIKEIQIQTPQNQKQQKKEEEINLQNQGLIPNKGNDAEKDPEADKNKQEMNEEPDTPTFEKKPKQNLEKNQENKVEIQQKVKQEPPEICIICFDPVANIKLQICAHTFCQPCLNEYLQEMVIKPKYLDQLMCPSCKTKLDIESVQQYINKQIFNQISDLILESGQIYGLGVDDALVKCFQCEACFLVNKGLVMVKCHNCTTQICRKCNKNFHPNRTCEQAAKTNNDEESVRFQQYAQNQGWIKCPKCNQTIERYKGCNFMRCESSQCKKRTFFCFLCRQLLTSNDHYSHFKKNNPYGDDCIITLRKKKDQIQGKESQGLVGYLHLKGYQDGEQLPGQVQIQAKQQNQQNEQQQIHHQKQVQQLQKPNEQDVELQQPVPVNQQVNDQQPKQIREQPKQQQEEPVKQVQQQPLTIKQSPIPVNQHPLLNDQKVEKIELQQQMDEKQIQLQMNNNQKNDQRAEQAFIQQEKQIDYSKLEENYIEQEIIKLKQLKLKFDQDKIRKEQVKVKQEFEKQIIDKKQQIQQEQQQIVEQAKPKPIIRKNPIIRKIPTNLQSDPNFGPPQAEYNCFVLDMLTQFCRNCANELEACSSNIRKCQKCNTQYCNKCFSQLFSNHNC